MLELNVGKRPITNQTDHGRTIACSHNSGQQHTTIDRLHENHGL